MRWPTTLSLLALTSMGFGCYDFDDLREDDPTVSEAEVHAAGRSDDPSLDENLLRIVRQPEMYESDVLTAAIDALAEHRTANALEPLIALRTHEDEEVRWHVARALHAFDDERARHTLNEMATTDESEMVREMCTEGFRGDSP